MSLAFPGDLADNFFSQRQCMGCSDCYFGRFKGCASSCADGIPVFTLPEKILNSLVARLFLNHDDPEALINARENTVLAKKKFHTNPPLLTIAHALKIIKKVFAK